MATAAKKTAAPRQPADRPRKRAAAVPDIPAPRVDVLVLNSEDADGLEPDLVEIFKLDDKSYYIDRNQGAGVALRMMKILNTHGENEAVGAMLLELLGDDAYDALANFPGVTTKHLAQVLLTINKVIMGDRDSGPKA